MDAEFVAQTWSLANGWHEPNTMRALERGREAGALDWGDANELIENYRELRRIEGILRRWSYQGETVLPDHPAPLYRVAIRCGFGNPEQFMTAVSEHRHKIRQAYLQVFPPN